MVEQAQAKVGLKEQFNLEGLKDQGKRIQYVRDLDGLSYMVRRNETISKLQELGRSIPWRFFKAVLGYTDPFEDYAESAVHPTGTST